MVLQSVREFVLGRDRTFLFGFCGGILCVFIDIDHFIALATGIEYGRFLHPYYLIACIAIIGGCCTYIAGLLFEKVLRRKSDA